MSRFTRPLVVTPLPDGKTWVVVTGDFEFRVPSEIVGNDDTIIRVPQWMTTDFASTPKVLWSIMGGAWGKHGNAAVIHDYGYWKQDRPKGQYDRMFYEGMRILGVGAVQAKLMYWAVKLFGFNAWRGNRRKNAESGDDWKMHRLTLIPDLPVLAVMEEVRVYADEPLGGAGK